MMFINSERAEHSRLYRQLHNIEPLAEMIESSPAEPKAKTAYENKNPQKP